jgi:hypothetical protein
MHQRRRRVTSRPALRAAARHAAATASSAQGRIVSELSRLSAGARQYDVSTSLDFA